MSLEEIFGVGKDLNEWQMSARAVAVFVIALVLIRVSGRRSFGMQMPFDNVITILIGAVLSRAITGASPFVPVIIASTVIALLHRLCAWIAIYSDAFGILIKGDSEPIYQKGKLDRKKMKRMLVTEKDLIEGVRVNANLKDLEKAESVYVERDGKISVVKKE